MVDTRKLGMEKIYEHILLAIGWIPASAAKPNVGAVREPPLHSLGAGDANKTKAHPYAFGSAR